MKITTILKIKLKNILPHRAFIIVKKSWGAIYNPYKNFNLKISTLRFKKTKYISINFKDIKYDLLINPENGFLDKSLYVNQKYEQHLSLEMFNYIKEGDVVLDIGANIGIHAILMSNLVKDNGQVIAFEPLPKIYTQFEKSILKNNIQNIKINKYALGSEDEMLLIHVNNKSVASSSILNNHKADTLEKINIQVKKLDSLRLEKIDFIKLDVEGYEWNVFIGGNETIKKFKPTIIFEYSPEYFRSSGNESDGIKMLGFLKENHYKIYDLENKRREILDIETFIHEFDPGLRSQTNLLCLQK